MSHLYHNSKTNIPHKLDLNGDELCLLSETTPLFIYSYPLRKKEVVTTMLLSIADYFFVIRRKKSSDLDVEVK